MNDCQFIPIHISKDMRQNDSETYLNIDSLFILEASDMDGVCSISPKKLFKTLPLYQFQYLMDNKQYEEAEKLAMRYDMDSQVLRVNNPEQFVKKTRIQSLIKNTHSKAISTKELVQFLDEIIDQEFCIGICLNFQHETRQDFYYVLEYCYKRLNQSNSALISARLVEKLERQKRRLVTFGLLSNYQEFKYDEWCSFRSAPIPEVISKMFNDGNYEDAFLLWRRHCGGKS